ncbi:acyl carrier protein [Candidatus Woesearchaeota archaeon]|nr:acyl carrier protein [Candidatus Woesearchaeota archaeon]
MKKEQLRQFFSKFWDVPLERVTESLALDDTALADYSSVRFYQFIAALESRFGVRVEHLENVVTFGSLLESVADSPLSP